MCVVVEDLHWAEAGTLDLLPDATARALKSAVDGTSRCATGATVTLAIGYGGRQEVTDALRQLPIDAFGFATRCATSCSNGPQTGNRWSTWP